MIVGWDISTSIIGMAAFEDDGKYQLSSHLDLRKIDGQLSKAQAFKDWITGILWINASEVNHHFVEERLGGFAAGRTSAQVMMKLAQFNAICSYIIYTHEPQFESARGRHRSVSYFHPSTWKSIMKREGLIIPKGADKKSLTLAFVSRKVPDFIVELNRNEKPQPWCYDEADAFCLGRSGFLKLCTETKNSQP